jgi:glycosyltransferase involved in cell wall biosynthesis
MNTIRKSVHVWVPGLKEGSGGIQAFSRIYLQAIREAYPQIPLRVFVKNDELKADDPLRLMGIKIHSVCRVPSFLQTLAFAAYGIFFAIRDRPCCSVTTHLNFLPVLDLLRMTLGIPCSSILHGIEAWNINSRIRIRALRMANHLTAVSEFTRQHVIAQFGVDAQRINVVPNTFDTARFTPGDKPTYLMERYGFKPGQPVLMTVSRLSLSERYKGHRQVLMALTEIRKQFPDVRYLIVGSGDDLQSIKDLVKARSLDDCVVFAGYIPGSELPDHYRLCDLFVMPSSKEGFGIVFLEAMASGKPVIAGCIDGSVDAVAGGRLSPMVDPNNVAQITEAILNILRQAPPDALWFHPQELSRTVNQDFGYPRVSHLMAHDLAIVVKSLPAQQASLSSLSKSDPAYIPKLIVLCRSMSEERIDFFNVLSDNPSLNLEVIYFFKAGRSDLKSVQTLRHNHLITSQTSRLSDDLRRACRSADLVIFADELSWCTLRVMNDRNVLQKAWVFWADPSNFPAGRGGAGWLKQWRLQSLLHDGTPIWVSQPAMLTRLRRQYGGSRHYQPFYLPSRANSGCSDPDKFETCLSLEESVKQFWEASIDAICRYQARKSV